MQRVRVIDSHTEGEPTRVIIEGAPDLGPGSAAQRLQVLRDRSDRMRSAVVTEPRGHDAVVGAVLLEPKSKAASAQVIFFNNVGYLGMCVHGTIGVVETLRHLGRIGRGSHLLETPVGDVAAEIRADGSIAVRNVESFRHAKAVDVETESHGRVSGDIAWGGNWFFLTEDHGQDLTQPDFPRLTRCASDVRRSLARWAITGADGGEIDHIELLGPPTRADTDSRNFVLCPGLAFDRSPCGTGTSAKMACLAADGVLSEGERWRQESILGTCFVGSIEQTARGVIPTVAGRAWITAESTLLFQADDPFRDGIRV
ncbi:MAG TPA: proline racemase family protein [Gemmatimonadales bacterium]|nr:proline racemase family protein [Gemmatimonadales bacterium]